ncbi:oligosaccharide flippase family protein [Microbulbifer agarilyticus]|uniref:oligosaccharide flippase family protein n=1 Tax=Microbulbifer agarilyticus TaxID=260552 RepID=UPI001C942CE2|nr:oligosaccharide flippase family protein [Microbulbifer agarilyticus]MBY6190729.1 oligosaccharide flippase family protein [Microbulbifer agarilyticus]
MSVVSPVAEQQDKGLGRSTVRKASYWVFGGYATGQVLRFSSNLIMTRLLAPEMFGIMALANVVIAGIQMLTDVGIQKSIIQSKSGTRADFLNTAWILQIFRGVSLAAIVCGIAIVLWLTSSKLPADSVYANPDLPLVLSILAASLVIGGFRSTKSAVSNRNLQLTRITSIDLFAQISAIAVMIIWATLSPSIWALVAGTIVSSVVRISAEYIFLPGANNRWQWNWDYASEIFHFGKWIFASSLLTYWVLNGDRMILGFEISAREMGVYAIAIFVVSSVRGALNSIMQKVMFPALSTSVRNNEDYKKTYYRFRSPLDFFICGICGFLIVSGEQIINILYDSRYREAGPFLAVLAIGLLADRYRGLGLFYQADGRPKMMLPVAISRAVLISIGLPFVLYEYGFSAAVMFLGTYPLLVVPLQLYLKYKAGLMSVSRELLYTTFIIPGAVAGYVFLMITTSLV